MELKKKRPTLKIILAVLLFLVLLIGAVGGKVYFDVKTAVTKAYVNPPTQMTSVSLKKEAFTTAILGISKIDGKDVFSFGRYGSDESAFATNDGYQSFDKCSAARQSKFTDSL